MNFGLKLEDMLEKSFRRWGVFVATWPVLVMTLSLIVSFGLAMGLVWWKVTTDPVDLWVSSASEARRDMEYFNEHFWKFYRIQQVVIAPSDETLFRMNYTKEPENPFAPQLEETFGPAFRQDFMQQIFRLQQDIERLTVADGNRNITLDSICFKPLDKECATQSIFTYYLDNANLLNASDYINRIAVCTR